MALSFQQSAKNRKSLKAECRPLTASQLTSIRHLDQPVELILRLAGVDRLGGELDARGDRAGGAADVERRAAVEEHDVALRPLFAGEDLFKNRGASFRISARELFEP